MPPGQRLLRAWARLAVRLYYRDVHVSGARVEPGRPTVVAVNHTNALGDVALLIDDLPRFPRFLAASSWWSHAPARALFRLGRVLPVDRAGDHVVRHHNRATFAACDRALGEGAHIAIFPEGKLNLGPGLLAFHTGAARIALGAAIDAGVEGVVIVPVALGYESRGRMRSNVAVRYGAPIAVDDWIERSRCDPVAAAHELTDVVRRQLAEGLELADASLVGTRSPEVDRSRVLAEMVALTPLAVVGFAASAPVAVPLAVTTLRLHQDAWCATIRVVGATFLLPVTWTWLALRLAHRCGRAQAWVLVGFGVASGRASLAWLERLGRLRA